VVLVVIDKRVNRSVDEPQRRTSKGWCTVGTYLDTAYQILRSPLRVYSIVTDSCEDILQVDMVIAGGWIISVDGVFRRIYVQGQVYAGSVEGIHAFIMLSK